MKKIILIVIVAIAGYWLYQNPSFLEQFTKSGALTTATPVPTDAAVGQAQGKVFFALTDDAVDIKSVQAINVTITGIRMHSQAKGWTTVSTQSQQYDLLKLKQSGAVALLAEASANEGTYDEVRLDIQKVMVTRAGKAEEAKLPSNTLKLKSKVAVKGGQTSSVVFDVLADKSLHTTGSGKLIFAPVVKVESRSNTEVAVKQDNTVDVAQKGTVDANVTVGMDVNGETKENFVLDTKTEAKVEVDSGLIKVIPKGENESSVNITSKAASETAVKTGGLDIALTTRLVTENGVKVWYVNGLKGLETTQVKINATTGVVVQ